MIVYWHLNIVILIYNIRDELREEYVVEIDDENKEWMIVSPRGAMWSNNGNDGGRGNIVSKEEWDAEDDKEEQDDGDEYKEQDDEDVAFDDFITWQCQGSRR